MYGRKQGKMRRRIQILCLAIAVVLCSIMGCSSFEGKDSAKRPESFDSKKNADGDSEADNRMEGETITMMASNNWIKDIDRELIKKFKEETGIEVKVMVTPDNGYETLLGTILASGGEVIDIFMYDAGKPMVSMGIPDIAFDLSEQPWVERMEDWATDANTYDGRLYGFSTWGVDYEGILYNKTFFEEHGLEPAKNWEEFIALCDDILELGKVPLYEPINSEWHTEIWFYTMINEFNKEQPDTVAWLNESKYHKISSLEVAKKGVKQLADFFGARNEDGTHKYYTINRQSEVWSDSCQALTSRHNIMIATYSAYSGELAARGSKDVWGMFPIPVADNNTVVTNGGGKSKYVNKYSQKLEACLAYLEFLAEPENLDIYYESRTDLVTAAFKNVHTVSVTNAAEEALKNSVGEPEIRMNNDMLYWDAELYKYFQGFADGTMLPEQFLKNMDDYRTIMFETAENYSER